MKKHPSDAQIEGASEQSWANTSEPAAEPVVEEPVVVEPPTAVEPSPIPPALGPKAKQPEKKPAGEYRPWPKSPKDDDLVMGQLIRKPVGAWFEYGLVAGGHGMRADRGGQPVFVQKVADSPEGTETAGAGATWTTAQSLQIQKTQE